MKHKLRDRVRYVWPKIIILLRVQFIGLAFSISCALCSGCATGYLADRCRDGADVFSATVGLGGGAKVRLGPANIGLYTGVDLWGLRGGEFPLWDESSMDDGCFILLEHESFYLNPDPRNKSFASGPYRCRGEANPACLYTQIDVVIALGPSIRLGFNPGELLDFILGWTTMDIYSDDIGKIESNKKMQATPQ
jgi:hypothetical protein